MRNMVGVTRNARANGVTHAATASRFVIAVIVAAIVATTLRPGTANACGMGSFDDDYRPASSTSSSSDYCAPQESERPRNWYSAFVPGITALTYRPTKGAAWQGAGANLTLAAWSINGHRAGGFGFDVAVLSTAEPGRRMTLWHFAADATFERSARRFMLPYWAVGAGEARETALGNHGVMDASVGMHLIRQKTVMLDVEGGLVLPFSAADRLAGTRVQAKLVFGLW